MVNQVDHLTQAFARVRLARRGYVRPMSPVAVVTGASAGVGRAVVRAFAGRGYDVALLARGADGLQAAADEVSPSQRRTDRESFLTER